MERDIVLSPYSVKNSGNSGNSRPENFETKFSRPIMFAGDRT